MKTSRTRGTALAASLLLASATTQASPSDGRWDWVVAPLRDG